MCPIYKGTFDRIDEQEPDCFGRTSNRQNGLLNGSRISEGPLITLKPDRILTVVDLDTTDSAGEG